MEESLKVSTGIIYIIKSDSTDEVYVSYSIDSIEKVRSIHLKNYESGKQTYRSYQILKHADAVIKKVKTVEYTDKSALIAMEKHYIQKFTNKGKVVINKKRITDGEEQASNARDYIFVKHECECGGKYSLNDRKKHFKTKKHIKFMESQ